MARSIPCLFQILIIHVSRLMQCVPVLSTMHAVPFEFFARKIVIIVAENPNSASESLADGHLKILGH